MEAPPRVFVASTVSPIPPSSHHANEEDAKNGNDYVDVEL
jgi:hypothetical protein